MLTEDRPRVGDLVTVEAEASPHRPRPTSKLWMWWLGGGLLVVAGYMFIPSPIAQSFVYDGMAALAVLGIVLGVRINRPASRLPWYLLAVGVAMWLAGDLTWAYYEHVLHIAPFPSIADVLYLGAMPFFAAGLYLMSRPIRGRRDRGAFIDAALITVSLSVVEWVFIMDPYLHDPTASPIGLGVSLAYPILDLLCIGVLAGVVLVRPVRNAAFWLIAGGLLLTVMSDGFYGFMLLQGTYQTGQVVDLGWLLFYLAWGTAALHPSMCKLSSSAPIATELPVRSRIAMLGLVSMLPPALLLFNGVEDPHRVPVMAAASLIMFALASARMGGLWQKVEKALGQLRAVEHDRAQLVERTLRSAEEERTRLAAELHDRPIQRLSTLGFQFDAAMTRLDRGEAEKATGSLRTVRTELAGEIQGLRRLMTDLRPPALDQTGLADALNDEVRALDDSEGVSFSAVIDPVGRLDPELETVLYRVAKEALTNVVKHAQARNARLSLARRNGSIDLTVADDGVGFDLESVRGKDRKGHFGMIAMRERVEMTGGEWAVHSVPGMGTTVRATFSVESADD